MDLSCRSVISRNCHGSRDLHLDCEQNTLEVFQEAEERFGVIGSFDTDFDLMMCETGELAGAEFRNWEGDVPPALTTVLLMKSAEHKNIPWIDLCDADTFVRAIEKVGGVDLNLLADQKKCVGVGVSALREKPGDLALWYQRVDDHLTKLHRQSQEMTWHNHLQHVSLY